MSYIEDAIAEMSEIVLGRENWMERFNRVSKGEVFILKYLSQKNGAVFPTELSEALGSTTGRISTVLGTLEKKGLLLREIDTSNRRNILVTLTPAGREKATAMEREMIGHMTYIFTEMGERDTKELLRLLRRVDELFHGHPPPNPME